MAETPPGHPPTPCPLASPEPSSPIMCPQPPQPVSDPSGLMSLQLEPVPEIRTMPPAGSEGGRAVIPGTSPSLSPRGKLSPTVVGGGGHGPDSIGGDVVTLAQVGEALVQLLRQLANGVLLVTPTEGQPLPRAGGSPSLPRGTWSRSILWEDAGSMGAWCGGDGELTSERRGTWGSAPALLLASLTIRSILSRHFSEPMS